VSAITPGQKLIITSKGKVWALVVVGKEPLEKGLNIIASHIDSPRLDLKPRPLYEADGMVLFKTHYYGGIKKYQWVAMPLALHGVVVKKDGKVVNIVLGEDKDDMVFTIADLLPHLAKDQMDKKMAEAVKGEALNVLIGSRPTAEGDNDPLKQQVLKLLKDKYDIEEDDFTSAELELVPAHDAREIGFDRSMIGAYGQDDRVSAYTSLISTLEVENPGRTAVCLFVDKEEIGSTGNTGLQSLVIENLVAELMHLTGNNDYYSLRKALVNSYALSADVNSAVDPNYPDVFEKMNNSFMGNGIVLTKYTGSRGKYDSNDANPEFLGQMRKLFDDNEVIWQIGELGKVDIGGGGTVAQYMARYGMEVVDCGVALLGMHSPFEVASKADVYMAYKAYKAFLQNF
ncbi:MAG TPA: aminopeptidase, partial [Syntrophomonadaceae bacterium]|nr:aminopeptidase [Syntrophomonadaceae bacterium]